MDPLSTFLPELLRAASFEKAANLVLDTIIGVVSRTIATSLYANDATVLRATLHVRSSDGYRQLIMRETDGLKRLRARSGTPHSSANEDITPSTGAWQLIMTSQATVAIDVETNKVVLGDALCSVETADGHPGAVVGQETRDRLVGRNATHLLVVPMRIAGGDIHGMIEVEVNCRKAIKRPFVWPECERDVTTLVTMATPYLLILPTDAPCHILPGNDLPVIGKSMHDTIKRLEAFARFNHTLLLTGPSGVGKTRLAKWCHDKSGRKGPFEPLHLHSFPETLQMSELFGTIKGSYTSADRSRPGAVARARGGTLFIDEIDKLSLETQAGLLRLLDEGVYRPIGSSDEALEANVRFIVGTNVNLWEAVQCGRFRHDLYWRINVFPIKIPPLDERRDEIIDWAKYMLRRAQSADGTSLQERPPVEFTKDAQDLLFSIRWPGNLRQLDNVVRRAYVFFHSDHVGRNAPALVTKHHMQLALQHEGAEATSPTSVSEQSSAFDHLKRAAAACVDVHRRRADEDRPLPPNAPDDFQHLVLRIAMDDMGVDEAMRLFGRTKAIRQRNTARTVDAVNEGVARLRTHFEPKSEVSSSYEAAIHRKHNE